MEKRILAAGLYELIETTEDNILSGMCYSLRDLELGTVIHQLLKFDKGNRIYPYACCLAASSKYNNPYARRRLYEEAVYWLKQAEASEEKIARVQKCLDRDVEQTQIQDLANERIVHPDVLSKIKGIEYFDKTKLNFHDAYVLRIERVEYENWADIELELKPTWTDYSFKIKLNDVIDFHLNGSSNFVQIYWASFYPYNGYLVCDMEGFGTITCHDAEIVSAEELSRKIKVP